MMQLYRKAVIPCLRTWNSRGPVYWKIIRGRSILGQVILPGIIFFNPIILIIGVPAAVPKAQCNCRNPAYRAPDRAKMKTHMFTCKNEYFNYMICICLYNGTIAMHGL
jgi:hypothetical protein